MFLCRLMFFNLYESPRYLLTQSDKPRAVATLQFILVYNSRTDLTIHLDSPQRAHRDRLGEQSVGLLTEEVGGSRPAPRLGRMGSRSTLRERDTKRAVGWREAFRGYVGKIGEVWDEEWRWTTGLMCTVWACTSLGSLLFFSFHHLRGRNIEADDG